MEDQTFMFAEVADVQSGVGISLKLPGQSNATTKYYKCNTAVTFQVGDRVKVLKDSGTYIVEYPVGYPA